LDAGFDHIIVTQIRPDQHLLLEAFEEDLAAAVLARA